MKICYNCHNQIEENIPFCPICNAPQYPPPQKTDDNRKFFIIIIILLILIVLAIILWPEIDRMIKLQQLREYNNIIQSI